MSTHYFIKKQKKTIYDMLGPEDRMCYDFCKQLEDLERFGFFLPGVYWSRHPAGTKSGPKRSRQINAMIDKVTGSKKGVWDYFFRNREHILWMEAKSSTGKLTPEQKTFREKGLLVGDKFEIFRDAAEGLEFLYRHGMIKKI